MPTTLKQWLELKAEDPLSLRIGAYENGIDEGFFVTPKDLRPDGMLDTYVYPEGTNDEVIVTVDPNDYIVDTIHWNQHMDGLHAIVKKKDTCASTTQISNHMSKDKTSPINTIPPITKKHMQTLNAKRKRINVSSLFKEMQRELSSDALKLRVVTIDRDLFYARFQHSQYNLFIENDKPIRCVASQPIRKSQEKQIDTEIQNTLDNLIKYLNKQINNKGDM